VSEPPDDAARLAELVKLGDRAYEDMYETRYPTGPYSTMKDCMIDAIALAEKLGRHAQARELQAELDRRKAIFRSQFS
jgi:hypothetical protein